MSRALLSSYLALLRMGFARHRCHHRSGELLPHLFTLTAQAAVWFLWHFPGVAPPGRYPASCPVELGLSSSNNVARGHPVYLTKNSLLQR